MKRITQRGHVKFYNTVDRRGVIFSDQGEFFFRVGVGWRPVTGDEVVFEIATDLRSGRIYADQVRPAEEVEVARAVIQW